MRIKTIFKKKAEGLSAFIATSMCVFVMFLMFMVMFLGYSRTVSHNKVERVYRQYLLEMEREGYLTPSDKAGLIADLAFLGVENIDLSGTSLSPVGYGNEVTLRIKGVLKLDEIGFTNGKPGRKKGVVNIDIHKTGTALY